MTISPALQPFATDSALARAGEVAQAGQPLRDVLAEMERVIVGQRQLLARLVIGLLSDGHLLIEGLPGLAKTLTVTTLASTLTGSCRRIQFTPDLLPGDLTGTLVLNPRSGEFTVQLGPVFANIVLADEVNRAPAKVQSALLEAMQERQVTIGGETHALPPLFLVLATQNPVEHEGTYPLPEAQVDRFMFKLVVSYPSRDEERLMLDRMTDGAPPQARPVTTPEQVLVARQTAQAAYADPRIKEYVLDLVRTTRDPAQAGLAQWAPYLAAGASPRAAIYLLRAAKAHAFLEGRGYVLPEDVRSVAADLLRHRLLLTFRAEAEGISPDAIVERVVAAVPVP